MLNHTITVASAIAEHERSLQELREHLLQHPEEGVMQLIPTGSFWFGVGGVAVGNIVSLMTSPGAPWEANHEHWFGVPSIDFGKVFDSHDNLTIDPQIHCGTVSPCATLLTQMKLLASTWNANFQMYALGVLAPEDWTTTPPQLGGKLYAFEAVGDDPTRPRMVFDVNATDPTKLDRIVWLSQTNTLSTYPLETLVLKYAGDSLPDANYYYTASR